MDTTVALVEWHQTVEAAYRADGDRLWRAVYAYAGDPDVASEAVSEAYAQALRRGASIRDLPAWTWRTSFRIAAGALKTRRTAAVLEDQHAAESTTYHDRYADPDLLDALRHLPDAQRAAVVLYYYGDLSTRQISERTGSNVLSVRANLSRGRRRLRELLGNDDD